MALTLLKEVATVVIPALTIKFLLWIAQPVYGFIVKLIAVSQKHDCLSVYADLEEILGDFLEKYRHWPQKKPLPVRGGFFVSLFIDIFGLFWGLLGLGVQHLFRPASERA